MASRKCAPALSPAHAIAVATGHERTGARPCQKVILLLHGYDKGEDASKRRQQRVIEEARRRLAEVKGT